MSKAKLTCPRVEVGLGLRREFQGLLDWAERGGCYVNYRLVNGFLENYYLDLVVEGEDQYPRGIHRWMKANFSE